MAESNSRSVFIRARVFSVFTGAVAQTATKFSSEPESSSVLGESDSARTVQEASVLAESDSHSVFIRARVFTGVVAQTGAWLSQTATQFSSVPESSSVTGA